MKRAIAVAVVLALVGAGAYVTWWRPGQETVAAPPPVTAVVQRGTLRLMVPSTGRVVSNLDVDIKCKASGAIVRLPFDVSDSVKKDDLLVELDPVDEERVLKQAEVALEASQAKLAVARQNLTVAERTLATDRQQDVRGRGRAHRHAGRQPLERRDLRGRGQGRVQGTAETRDDRQR